MKKINKSKIALFMALTLALNGNGKSRAMNYRTMEFASGVMGNMSSCFDGALGAITAAGSFALFCLATYLETLEKRDKVAKTIISSLKSKGQLENIKEWLAVSKTLFEEIFKKNPQNFVGNKVKFGVDFDVKAVAALGSQNLQYNSQIQSALGQILVLKNMLGVKLNEQLESQILIGNLSLFINYGILISMLITDVRMPLIFDKADIPFSVDFIRSKKNSNNNNSENLSVICSMNFISSKRNYSNRHKICIRMSDKFELLVDGSSYDIDKLSKELG